MSAIRTRGKIPPIFYAYVVVLLAMTALAVIRVNGAAGSPSGHHGAILIADQQIPS